MKKWLVISVLCGYYNSAHAAFFDQNANDFFQRCNGKEDIICTATAAAYFDMMYALGFKCNDNGVNRIQVKDVLLKHLRNHPENRNSPLPFSAILAFKQAFKCAIPPSTKP